MKQQHQQLGRKGENIACRFLEEQGYRIVCRNYRSGRGELDIICRDDSDLVIVEVKSIRSAGHGSGEERISRGKKRLIIATTYAFLGTLDQIVEGGVRFDLVTVDFSFYPCRISHYRGIFWDEPRGRGTDCI